MWDVKRGLVYGRQVPHSIWVRDISIWLRPWVRDSFVRMYIVHTNESRTRMHDVSSWLVLYSVITPNGCVLRSVCRCHNLHMSSWYIHTSDVSRQMSSWIIHMWDMRLCGYRILHMSSWYIHSSDVSRQMGSWLIHVWDMRLCGYRILHMTCHMSSWHIQIWYIR